MNKMNNYLMEFDNPPAKFRGAPFWAWNTKLDKDTILRQVDYFKEMGMGGFTIHCRTGLDTPYLGEEYMDMVKACVEKARTLDMKVYLYDEDRWPSGFGGGEVTKDPAFRSRYLVFTPISKEEYISDSSAISDGGDNGFFVGNGELIARYDVTLKDGYLVDYRRLGEDEISDNVWYAYIEISPSSPWFNNEAYVNTLDKQAIERFIETTHEKYKKEVGEDFGDVIPSIFTDEPQFKRKSVFGRAEDKVSIILPYADDFEKSYSSAYQDSFLDYLPEVFWELPNGLVSVTRYHYHDHITERFACAFSDTIGEWCTAHNLQLTGHMMEEPTLESQTAAVGEAMRSYRGFHIPGIDMLCDQREYTTAKQAQSASHQMGGNEITSELYGVTNWDFDFRGHKLQGDWQAALGVTHRVHHLSWVSMEGEAKRDYPASIFYQSPWYQKYEPVETYFGRVNTALMSGTPNVRVGVIHPIESYWLYYGPDEQTAALRKKLDEEFLQVNEWLLFGLIDFDYISESLLTTLSNGATKEGFQVGEMLYDVIVVPGCKTLRQTTLNLLDDYVTAGGEVIFMGDSPAMVDSVPSDLPEQLVQRTLQIDFDESSLLKALSPYRVVDMHNARGIRSNDYIYQMRNLGEDKVIFIANGKENVSKDIPNSRSYRIALKGIYKVTLLDPLTGDKTQYPVKYENNTTVMNKKFFDQDSLLLYLTKEEINTNKDVNTNDKAKEIEEPSSQLIQVLNTVHHYDMSEPNVLILDQAEYALDGEAFRPAEEVLRIDNILRTQLNYPLKMSALAQPWTEKEEEQSSHTLVLKFSFQSEISVNYVSLAMEHPEAAQLVLNGVEIHKTIKGYFVDECIKTLSIPELKVGWNELLITIPYSRKTNLEWCYLLGDFGVQVYGNRAKIVEKPCEIGYSDLCNQKFPFYAGNMIYGCDVDLEAGDYEIEVAKFRSPLVLVEVDDTEVGSIYLSPYRIRLGHLQGKHQIKITAYGNRVNSFGTIHNCNDHITWFGPNAWRTTGNEYSYEYQLSKTGILAAPKLYRSN